MKKATFYLLLAILSICHVSCTKSSWRPTANLDIDAVVIQKDESRVLQLGMHSYYLVVEYNKARARLGVNAVRYNNYKLGDKIPMTFVSWVNDENDERINRIYLRGRVPSYLKNGDNEGSILEF